MAVPKQNLTAWKVIMSFLHVIAISSTFVRLYDRFLERRLGWDDYLSLVPTALDILFFVGLWIGIFAGKLFFETTQFFGSFIYSLYLHVSILWTARIVLALSLSRLFLPNSRSRRVAYGLVVLFALMYIIIIIYTTVTCQTPGLPWYEATGEDCKRTSTGFNYFTIMGLASDIVSDLALVILPMVMIWHIRLPSHQRRLILIAVSSSILTVGTAVAFGVVYFSGKEFSVDAIVLGAMIVNLEALMSLLACNFFVVFLFFYRKFNQWNTSRTNRQNRGSSTKPDTDDTPLEILSVHPTFETNASRRLTVSKVVTEKYSAISLTDISESDAPSSYPPPSTKPSAICPSRASSATGNLDLDSRYTPADEERPRTQWTVSSIHP